MREVRSLLVVDAEKFSHHRDAELPGVHLEIRRAVESACERGGLGEMWEGVRFRQSTGDGLLAALPLAAMTQLISPFADELQNVLAEGAPSMRGKGLRPLRMRVALHIGMVDDEHPEAPGISTATTDVNRLLDCEPLRDVLDTSDPDVTFAAVAVSAEAFAMFVQGGYTDLKPSQFTEVRARVKQFDRPAYLFVPKPSRREDEEDGPDAGTAPPTPPAPPGGQSISHFTVNGEGAQNIVGAQISGDLRQDRS
ncbi:hypothetical protein [Actinomadura sp. WMMB 499]|uniref:hypothetical protein n=1 Tax=Actinomadura sp. WMMB 499 TaxID=1219491 RepID=UPI001245FAC7|nr:hypothetical protein [Actinomadura sp. WMMB 499]QFG24207.1 hypothetical protein F7P10_26870 [Actinomadura sp. WMMB 499]